MRTSFKILLSIFLITAIAFAKPTINVDKNNLAIKGYDPVSYLNHAPKKGKKEFKTTFKSIEYHFINQQNLEKFKTDPKKYIPALGGWCAYAMLEGKKVEINPKSYKWVDDQLYLFYDGLWGDTLKMWKKKIQDGTSEEDLVSQVSAHWNKLKSK